MLFCACLLFPSLLSSFLFYVSTLFSAVWCPAWLMTEAQQTNPRDGWLWGAQPPSDKATKRCMFTFITNNLASNTNNRLTTPACLFLWQNFSSAKVLSINDEEIFSWNPYCRPWLFRSLSKLVDIFQKMPGIIDKDWALDHIVAWGCVKKDRARKYRELE